MLLEEKSPERRRRWKTVQQQRSSAWSTHVPSSSAGKRLRTITCETRAESKSTKGTSCYETFVESDFVNGSESFRYRGESNLMTFLRW